MPTHTLISGETIQYDASPELAAFITRAALAVADASVTVSDLVELVYGEENPRLVRGILPGRGYVTAEVLADPVYRVFLDLLDRKRVAVGTFNPAGSDAAHTLTVSDAAARLGISTGAVRQAIAAGRLAAIKRGAAYWLRPEAVASYKLAPRGPAAAEARTPVLRVRMGSSPDVALQIRTDGQIVIEEQAAEDGRTLNVGRLEGAWTWVAVKLADKERGSLRVFVLVPGTAEETVKLGDYEVSGRFQIVEKHNSAKAAEAAWKARARFPGARKA